MSKGILKTNLLPRTAIKTFSLLSIGQRGVGKTVFLAGSYAELHASHRSGRPQQLRLDCRDAQAQKSIENILSYIARTGQYPPPTIKITNFNFSLKRHNLWGIKTLCHFRWWDVPGEICNTRNPDFQSIVLSSHGCCVFINANALVHDPTYPKALEDIINQVGTIASLVHQHHLKYAFALVLTKFDLLEPGPLSLLKIEENLQPLSTRLDALKANYQRFYSAMPIVSTGTTSTLKVTDAATPLLWLISELRKSHGLQSRQDLTGGLMQSLAKSAGEASAIKKRFGLNLPPRRYILVLSLAGISLLGAIAALLFTFSPFTSGPQQAQTPEEQIEEYEQVLQREPNNSEALIKLARLYIQLGQPNRAIPLMEKLVQQKPENLDLRLNLAQLYELTGQERRAETTYDQILARQENHLMALISKAVLRGEQGDTKMARMLFGQAEEAAPSELKSNVRAIAEDTLQSSTAKSKPATK